MKDCPICNHAEREKIEWVLFKMGPSDSELNIEKIADEFGVDEADLKRHLLFHTPYGATDTDSIARRVKLKEIDLLSEAAQDMSSTMKVVGKRIRKNAKAPEDGDVTFERCLTKPVADLYLGCGDTLQKTIRAMADIDNLLNGPKDDAMTGLAALTAALSASRQLNQATQCVDELVGEAND